jgi:hypothetical protein
VPRGWLRQVVPQRSAAGVAPPPLPPVTVRQRRTWRRSDRHGRTVGCRDNNSRTTGYGGSRWHGDG